ncbi:hypothetical protein AB0C10_36485 [Microbispora amethystogenes]|uniref:hypothetical protein n=1 Tax=Microbispora amethystogenes TaxID=1427754 RepID=UPI00340E160E
MPLIPCTTGTVALFTQADGSQLAVLVEAWDEAGAPYIAGQAGLVVATAQPGFTRLERPSSTVPPPALPPTVVPVTPDDRPRGPKDRERTK